MINTTICICLYIYIKNLDSIGKIFAELLFIYLSVKGSKGQNNRIPKNENR